MERLSAYYAQELLTATLKQVRMAGWVILLIYLVASAIVPHTYSNTPKVIGFFIVSLAIILELLDILKRQKIMNALAVAMSLLMMYMAYLALYGSGYPIPEMLLWHLASEVVVFLLSGSRLGTLLSAAILINLSALMTFSPYKNSDLFHLWLTGVVVFIGTGIVIQRVTYFIESNLILHKETSEELYTSRLDSLTGLYGRGMLEKELNLCCNYALKNNTKLVIIVADIDCFKGVNDTYGHTVGDNILRAFARRLIYAMGKTNTEGFVGRWGGEEFIIVLPGISYEDGLSFAEKIREIVNSRPIDDLKITASFGVAQYTGQRDDSYQMFSRADAKMYEAKESGKNAVR